jgi:hypothetical protein
MKIGFFGICGRNDAKRPRKLQLQKSIAKTMQIDHRISIYKNP